MKTKKNEQRKDPEKDHRIDEEKQKFQNYNKFWNGNRNQSQRMTQHHSESNRGSK